MRRPRRRVDGAAKPKGDVGTAVRRALKRELEALGHELFIRDRRRVAGGERTYVYSIRPHRVFAALLPHATGFETRELAPVDLKRPPPPVLRVVEPAPKRRR